MTAQYEPRRRAGAVVHIVAGVFVLAAASSEALAQDTTPVPSAAPPAAPAPSAPASPAPAPKKPAPPLVGTPATVIDNNQIESVLGKSIQGPKGDDMGRIVDILIDRTGDVRAAVIDFGGFFGVGSRKIAVDWGSLHFKQDGKSDAIEADLPSDELRTAPVYKDGEPVVIIGGPPVASAPAPAPATPPAAPASPTTPPAAAAPATPTPPSAAAPPPAASPASPAPAGPAPAAEPAPK